MEIVNHSYSHVDFTKLTQKKLESEIAKCNSYILKNLGTLPRFLAVPFGKFNISLGVGL